MLSSRGQLFGILTFMSMIDFILICVEDEKFYNLVASLSIDLLLLFFQESQKEASNKNISNCILEKIRNGLYALLHDFFLSLSQLLTEKFP